MRKKADNGVQEQEGQEEEIIPWWRRYVRLYRRHLCVDGMVSAATPGVIPAGA